MKTLAYDFYLIVAGEVYKTCSEIMEGPEDREIVKGAVMTWFYGSKIGGFVSKDNARFHLDSTDWGRPKYKGAARGLTAKIAEVLKERGRSTAGANKLAKAVDKAIRELIPNAVKVRKFLEDIVRAYNKVGKHFRWVTPLRNAGS